MPLKFWRASGRKPWLFHCPVKLEELDSVLWQWIVDPHEDEKCEALGGKRESEFKKLATSNQQPATRNEPRATSHEQPAIQERETKERGSWEKIPVRTMPVLDHTGRKKEHYNS